MTYCQHSRFTSNMVDQYKDTFKSSVLQLVEFYTISRLVVKRDSGIDRTIRIIECNLTVRFVPFNITQQYDRAILDFGNVTNTGAVTNDVSEEVIIIEWDAVVIQNPLTDDAEDYWVSAGAEYNTETEIWVGQASFNLLTTLPVSTRLHCKCHDEHTQSPTHMKCDY